MDECFAYDDELRKNRHIVGGEALQSARNAATLRRNGGKVSVTDGRFTETKEQLGGFGGNRSDRFEPCHPVDVEASVIEAGSYRIRPTDA